MTSIETREESTHRKKKSDYNYYEDNSAGVGSLTIESLNIKIDQLLPSLNYCRYPYLGIPDQYLQV